MQSAVAPLALALLLFVSMHSLISGGRKWHKIAIERAPARYISVYQEYLGYVYMIGFQHLYVQGSHSYLSMVQQIAEILQQTANTDLQNLKPLNRPGPQLYHNILVAKIATAKHCTTKEFLPDFKCKM